MHVCPSFWSFHQRFAPRPPLLILDLKPQEERKLQAANVRQSLADIGKPFVDVEDHC